MNENPVPVITAPAGKNPKRFLLFGLVLFLVAGIALYFLSNNSSFPFGKTAPQRLFEDNKLFTSQSAIIEGRILSVRGKVLSIENVSGIKGEVETVENPVINDISIASPDARPKKVMVNKDAQIILNPIDDVFKVTIINYQPITRVGVDSPKSNTQNSSADPNAGNNTTPAPVGIPSSILPGPPISTNSGAVP